MHFYYDRIKQNECFIYFSGTATIPTNATQVLADAFIAQNVN